jgi:hypothetical protein
MEKRNGERLGKRKQICGRGWARELVVGGAQTTRQQINFLLCLSLGFNPFYNSLIGQTCNPWPHLEVIIRRVGSGSDSDRMD